MIPVLELFINGIVSLKYGTNDRFYREADVMEDDQIATSEPDKGPAEEVPADGS